MVFLLLISVLFCRPLTFFKLVGGEELKWRQLAHHLLMSQQGPYFSDHSKAKANDKITKLWYLVVFQYEEVDDNDNYLLEQASRVRVDSTAHEIQEMC